MVILRSHTWAGPLGAKILSWSKFLQPSLKPLKMRREGNVIMERLA